MRKFFLLSIASLAILPVAALAAPAPAKLAPAMPLGASVTPPLGLIELCQREPTECVRSGEVDQAKLAEMKTWASQARWATLFGAGPSALAEAPASAFPSDMRARGAAAERDQLAARTALLHVLTPTPATGDSLSGDDGSASPSTPVDAGQPMLGGAAAEPVTVATTSVSPLTARETAKINTRINRSIRRMTDAELYGRADYWAGGGDKVRQGDCEDYVMAKRHALISAGVPEDAVSIATVRTRYGELHAVLLVATATGEVVLDNLSPWVLPWNEAPYRWLDRQVGGSPTHWVHVGA